MSRGGTLIFLCVRLVSASLCFRQSVFLPVYVSVRLYPCQSASLPVSTLSTVAHRALFHRSLSNLSGSFCSSRLSCSFLFPPYLFIPLFLFLFLFFSDIFSSYSLDPSCSYRDTLFWAENPVSRTDFRTLGSFPFRDTPFSVKKPVSRAYSAKLWRTTCSDTPFWAENPVSRKGRAMLSVKWALLRMRTIIWWHSSVKWSFLRMVCFVRSVIFRCHLVMCQELTVLWGIGTTNRHYCPFPGGWCAIKCCFLGTSHPDLGDMTSGSLPHLMNM